MPDPKKIDQEFKEKIEDLLRLGFVSHPPTGPSAQENFDAIWKSVSTYVVRYEMKYRKSMQWRRERECRGWFNGAAVRAWDQHFNDYRGRLWEYAKAEHLAKYQQFRSDPADFDNFYWPSQLNPPGALAARPRTPSTDFSPKMAEGFATQTMLFLGAWEAETTKFTKDGGVDCLARDFVVQVKHLNSKVAVSTVRETIAVAQMASRQPVIFSKSGFTFGAIELAIDQDVILFQYFPTFIPQTNLSNRALIEGLSLKLVGGNAFAKREERSRRKSGSRP